MTILSDRCARNNTHEPELCGLDPVKDCDACRAARDCAEREYYDRDDEDRRRTRRRAIAGRLAQAAGCQPAELVELVKLIAWGGEL